MRVLSTIASVLVALLVMAAGVLMCWTASSALGLDRVNMLVYDTFHTLQGRMALGVTGVLLCVLALVALVRLLGLSGAGGKKRSIVFASSLGEVRVAVDTIERYLSRVGNEIPDVQKLSRRFGELTRATG